MLSDQTLQRVFGLGRPATARWGDLIRAATTTLAGLVVAAMVVSYARTVETTVRIRDLQDFGLFDRSTRQLREGAALYEPLPDASGAAIEKPRNLNPPHFHLLLLTLTGLPPVTAFAAWLILSLMALIWAIVLLRRAIDLRVWGLATLVAAVVVSPAMHATLMTGQVGMVLLLPFTWAWLAARAGRDRTAGVWLGVCASIKPFVLLFAVAYVVQRRWRAVVAMAATVAAIFVLGVLVLGVGSYVDWIRQLGAVTWAEHYMNASIQGLLERTFSATPWGLNPLVDAPGLIQPLWIVIVAAITAVTYLAWQSNRDVDQTFVLTSAAMLLISPLGWIYYLWFLMPPVAALLADGGRLSRRQFWLVAAGLSLLFVPSPFPWRSFMTGIRTATAGSIYTWGLLLLWGGFAAAAWSKAPAARGSLEGEGEG